MCQTVKKEQIIRQTHTLVNVTYVNTSFKCMPSWSLTLQADNQNTCMYSKYSKQTTETHICTHNTASRQPKHMYVLTIQQADNRNTCMYSKYSKQTTETHLCTHNTASRQPKHIYVLTIQQADIQKTFVYSQYSKQTTKTHLCTQNTAQYTSWMRQNR